MEKDKKIIEFQTNDGVNISLIKERNKYKILVSEQKKRVRNRKVFESLNTEVSLNQFHKLVAFFTKDLD